MGGWIKLDKDVLDDPRVIGMAVKLTELYSFGRPAAPLEGSSLLKFACNAVTGALVTLWRYADEHITDADALPNLPLKALDALVGLEGFCALMPPEWLVEGHDGCVVLPGYCEKNSLITKRKRAVKSNARVRRWRASRNAQSNAKGNGAGNVVTSAHVTQCNAAVDRDIDLDGDIKKKNKRLAPPRKRCPEDFQISPDLRAWAATNAPDVNLETETAKLRDHEFKTPRSDWPAAWRNWIRQAQQEAPAKRGNGADAAWHTLLATDGARPERTPELQRAIEAAGGWSAIRGRTLFDEQRLLARFREGYYGSV
jgi:hypothetical protein